MVGMAGFEPANARVKVLCLTAWRHPRICGFPNISYPSAAEKSIETTLLGIGSSRTISPLKEPALILKRRPAYLYAYLGGLSSLLDFFNTFTKHSSNWDYSIVSIALIYSLSPSLTINPMYKTYIYKAFHGLGPEAGFEPATFWLWAR